MNRCHKTCAMLAMCMTAMLLWGCAPTVSFTYEAPPHLDLSKQGKTLTVLPDQTCRAEDARWSQAAADRIIEQLRTENVQVQDRFTVIEPAALRQRIEEAGLQAAFSNPDDAADNMSNIENLDLIVYVRASTYNSEDRTAARVEGHEEAFIFHIGCKIVARVPWKNCDGKDVKHIEYSVGTISSDAESTERIVESITEFGTWEEYWTRDCEQFAQDFVGHLISHQIHVKATLAEGTNPAVKLGNSLATKSDYAGALKQYLLALEQDANDHGAAFNAGLMYEAAGKLCIAHEMYNRAIERNDKDARYKKARQRVIYYSPRVHCPTHCSDGAELATANH